jgi:predicted nucleic acid-binding protein
LKIKLYLDTSVISALFDKRTPERMAYTSAAWDTFGDFDVFLSELVISELERTPTEIKTEMMKAVRCFPCFL